MDPDEPGLAKRVQRGGSLAVTGVVDLAQGLGPPAGLHEVLGQGHGLRHGLAEMGGEVVDAQVWGLSPVSSALRDGEHTAWLQ